MNNLICYRIASHKAIVLLVLGIFFYLTPLRQAVGKQFFPDSEIPAFNIPKMALPPTIDGVIDENEWKQSVRVMGMATAQKNSYRGRPNVFWVSWDANHIYLAGRAHVLPGYTLLKSKRERFSTQVVFDDAFEFGLSMEGRNQPTGEDPSFFKFIVNSLKSGEYMKMYPSIGQYLYNWRPDLTMATRVYEQGGAQWFDIEIALDLEDLEMPVENRAGDLVKLLLAYDGNNPGWQWTCVPTATGYLVHDGYPRGVLTDDKPYVQVEQLEGFNDEKLALKSVIYNPCDRAVKVTIDLSVVNEKWRGNDEIEPKEAIVIDQEVEIPANGSVRFDLDRDIPGFIYGNLLDRKEYSMRGAFDWKISLVDAPDESPVYYYHLKFMKDAEKKHLQNSDTPASFNMAAKYNPVTHKIWIEADTLDAQLPDGTSAAGAVWSLKKGTQKVAEGSIDKFIYYKYQDLVQLPSLKPGKYDVSVSLIDAEGAALLTRSTEIEKKDEAKEFPEWWGKKYGNSEQLLKPFEPLRASGNKITVTRREYELDSLGLPVQIEANDGPVLTTPARIVMVVDGEEHIVPTQLKIKLTEEKDWRVSFEGEPSEVAGVKFSASGKIEQDGLVSLKLTYEPTGKPVRIQELWIEWPVDDTWQNYMACMGVGGNYSARFIGAVPSGQGEVWNTLRDIGRAGSGMTEGNFYQNLWVGTEKRGLFWWGNSDKGWVPNNRTAAHSIVRDGHATIIRNHIIGTASGDAPFELSQPRTVAFSYNASPFKKLTKGWRINLRSASNGFTEPPKYKWNWDTNTKCFSVLSPPFPLRDRWAEYYAHCLEVASERSRMGIYSPGPRLRPYLANQVALRGYERKSLEKPIYNYFSADWETSDSGETLNETYRDYMMWLQNRQVTEGGCRHFYYDISMAGKVSREIVADQGYLLPDGRIQPSGLDLELRKWYIRANALMQDNGFYPTGISGHATQTIPLVALPFSDAILDSEFPMKDPISVYPSERMIALSHPENFGCNINHLGFMNPNWAGMHDAGMGGGHGSVFDRSEWHNWGIEREDVVFVPYWRNSEEVRRIGDGLICSIWKKPGSVILGILNYGPDKEGFEQMRSGALTLDLAALGVPIGVSEANVRVEVLNSDQAYESYGRYVGHLKWYQDLPGTPLPKDKTKIMKMRPTIRPSLDLDTGALTGFDVFYHDQYYIALYWDEQAIDDAAWRDDLLKQRTAALNWGVNTAEEITVKKLVKPVAGECTVRVWRKAGSVMVLVANSSEKDTLAEIDLDIDALGLRVAPDLLWRDFTSVFALDGGDVKNVLWDETYRETRKHEYTRGGMVYDGYLGKLVGMIPAGQSRLICVDRY